MRFHTKAFVSLLLSLLFLVLGFSGVILYFTPRGRLANWTGWTMLGLKKSDWQALHMNIALMFLILAGLHLYLNWSSFWGYIRKRQAVFALNLRWEMLAALLITSGVLAGSIGTLPPFATLMTYNNRIKDYWEREPTSAPTPHAEELKVEQLAKRLGLPVEQLIDALRREGIVVESDTATIAQLAEASRLAPSDVYAIITKRFPGEGHFGRGESRNNGPGRGQGQGGGFGRKTARE